MSECVAVSEWEMVKKCGPEYSDEFTENCTGGVVVVVVLLLSLSVCLLCSVIQS